MHLYAIFVAFVTIYTGINDIFQKINAAQTLSLVPTVFADYWVVSVGLEKDLGYLGHFSTYFKCLRMTLELFYLGGWLVRSRLVCLLGYCPLPEIFVD